MARKKKVKDLPDFEKEETSQAVINTNSNAILARRAQIAEQKAKDEELQTMKNDIAEIKELLIESSVSIITK